MKKAKYLIGVLFALAIVGAAVFVIRFYPVFAGAGFLKDNLNAEELSYNMTLIFGKEQLTENQQVLVQTLTNITGISQEDLLTLKVKGQVEDDIIYAQIIPAGMDIPLTEFYLSKEIDVMNVRMMYDAICDYLAEQSKILAVLLPEWKGGEYVTIEQIEQIFSVDLSSIKEFEIAYVEEELSFLKCFGLLAVMEYEKDAGGVQNFSFVKDEAKVQMQFKKEQENTVLSMSCDAPKLQESLLELDNVIKEQEGTESLSQNQTLQRIQSLKADITIGQDLEIVIPNSQVQQETIDLIVAIQTILQEFM